MNLDMDVGTDEMAAINTFVTEMDQCSRAFGPSHKLDGGHTRVKLLRVDNDHVHLALSDGHWWMPDPEAEWTYEHEESRYVCAIPRGIVCDCQMTREQKVDYVKQAWKQTDYKLHTKEMRLRECGVREVKEVTETRTYEWPSEEIVSVQTEADVTGSAEKSESSNQEGAANPTVDMFAL